MGWGDTMYELRIRDLREDKDLNQNKLDSFKIFYDFVNENAKK